MAHVIILLSGDVAEAAGDHLPVFPNVGSCPSIAHPSWYEVLAKGAVQGTHHLRLARSWPEASDMALRLCEEHPQAVRGASPPLPEVEVGEDGPRVEGDGLTLGDYLRGRYSLGAEGAPAAAPEGEAAGEDSCFHEGTVPYNPSCSFPYLHGQPADTRHQFDHFSAPERLLRIALDEYEHQARGGWPVELLLATIQAESGWTVHILGDDGASIGLAQIKDVVRETYHYTAQEMHDPRLNIRCAIRLINTLWNHRDIIAASPCCGLRLNNVIWAYGRGIGAWRSEDGRGTRRSSWAPRRIRGIRTLMDIIFPLLERT